MIRPKFKQGDIVKFDADTIIGSTTGAALVLY